MPLPTSEIMPCYNQKRITHFHTKLSEYDFSDEEEQIIIEDYKKILFVFEIVCDKYYPLRRNLLPFIFCLEKICEMRNIEFAEIKTIRCPSKIQELNIFWNRICIEV
jgi:hypothetical protein